MLSKLKDALSNESQLKAKDLSKKLGFPKDQINSILYKNLNIFKVDEEFRWSLIRTDKLEISFEPKWVDCRSFETTLMAVGCPLSSKSKEIVFKFPASCSFFLEALGRLLALSNQLEKSKKKVCLDFQEDLILFHFLNRNGFFDHLNTNVVILPHRPKESTAEKFKGKSEALVEIGSVDPKSSNKDLINQLTDCFVNLSSSDYDNAAATIFGELIGNIKEHSKSKTAGFAGLQRYKGRKNNIQTIVSDNGVGIAKTLRTSLEEFHPKLHKLYKIESLKNDMNIVKAALSNGGISRYGEGRGLGFKSSKQQALKFNASFSVRQINYELRFVFRDGKLFEVSVYDDLVTILGTHICFDFYID